MQRHSDNAKAVAEYLAGHDKVTWVSYAGLPGDRYYNLAQKYCPRGAGAVLTFGVEGGYEAGIKIVSNRCKLFSHLANIGDAKSLIIHPGSTTHSQLTAEQRHRRRAPGRTSSAFRSASRTSPTSSPIWTRRSRRCDGGCASSRTSYLEPQWHQSLTTKAGMCHALFRTSMARRRAGSDVPACRFAPPRSG